MANGIKIGNLDISYFKVGNTDVDAIYLGNTLLYPKRNYLYTESFSGNSMTYTMRIGSSVGTDVLQSISYSVDSGTTWVTTNNSADTTVTITTPSTSGKVLWKGEGSQISVGAASYAGKEYATYLRGSGNFNAGGNPISLLLGDNFGDHSEFSSGSAYELSSLFYNATTLINSSGMTLPATIVYDNCYNDMFNGCTNMLTAPSILPATTVGASSYKRMFRNCKKLEISPIIVAQTFTEQTCSNMFYDCIILNTITCLAINTNATDCLKNWVSGVQTTAGTFYRNPYKTWSRGVNGVPNNWTIVDYSS